MKSVVPNPLVTEINKFQVLSIIPYGTSSGSTMMEIFSYPIFIKSFLQSLAASIVSNI